MNVWLIQTGEPVPLNASVKRMRTALLADELASRGHVVTWWASAFDHGSKAFVASGGEREPIRDGVEIRLLPALGYRKNLSLRRYIDHRYVARRFREALSTAGPVPDLVLAATPDYHIAADAGAYARSRGIPFVVDVRDPWPDAFVDQVPTGPGRAAARLLLAADFAKVGRMLRGARGLVAMMESMLDWGLRHAGRSRGPLDRVFYLGTEPLPEPDPDFLAELGSHVGRERRPVIVYVGTFGRYNHPGVIVEAVRRLDEAGTRAFDVVIGGGGDLFDAVAARAEGLEGVHLTGWLQARQIASVLAMGALGVVPWALGDAFPNKAFSYFAAGLPVVTSAGGDLRRILEGEGLGAYYPPGDAGALAEALAGLAGRPDRLAAMAQRVRLEYPLRFEASGIYRAYADYLEEVVGG